MSSKRWLAPWKDSAEKPTIYHCINRVVDRRFVFGDVERVSRRIDGRRFHGSIGVRWVWRWAAKAAGPEVEKGVVRPQMNTAEALEAKGLLWSFRDLRVGV